MALRLEVDPARLKSLRTRLGMPLHAGAKRANVSEEELASWEAEPTSLTVDNLQRLARAYNRNWYVFLLEDEEGRPAIPRDFRKARGASASLSHETLIAFDDASLLLDRIQSLAQSGYSVVDEMDASLNRGAEEQADQVRDKLGLDGPPEKLDPYAVLRLWRDVLSGAGLYVVQLPFPIDEVRGFCLSRGDQHLIVVSSRDWPTARSFSLLHELGHLLLGADAMCRPDEADATAGRSHEPWCNRFAASLLMPRVALESNPRLHDLLSGSVELGNARAFARELGVSELALFRRLETLGHISGADYEQLQEESDQRWKDRDHQRPKGRLLHPNKVIARQSPLFVRQVLDAHSRGDIPYREIGALLNTPLRSIPSIREAVA